MSKDLSNEVKNKSTEIDSSHANCRRFALSAYWRTTAILLLAIFAGIAIFIGSFQPFEDLTWEPWFMRALGLLILGGGMVGLFKKEETVVNLTDETYCIVTGWFVPRRITEQGKISAITGVRVFSRYPDGKKLPVREFAVTLLLKSKEQTIAESFERSEMLKFATELAEQLSLELVDELPPPSRTTTITF